MDGHKIDRRGFIGLAAATGLLSACGVGGGSASGHYTPAKSLGQLADAAKKEGTLVVYGAPAATGLTAVGKAFTKKYGVAVNPVRITTAPAIQRFSSELAAKSATADVLLINQSTFFATAVAKGWITPLEKAKIPGYPWQLPESYLRPASGTAVVGLQIRGISYNTNLVKGADIPTDWMDVVDPKWRGKIGVADPGSSPVYVGHWYTIDKAEHGRLLPGVKAQHPKVYASGSPTTAALGAGEIAIFPMNIASITTDAKKDGAPVAYVRPHTTAADEMQVAVNATAAHPAAARLFAAYLMSEEGAAALARAGGEASPFDHDLPHLLTWDLKVADQQKSFVARELGAAQ